jgi:hypothetical protein
MKYEIRKSKLNDIMTKHLNGYVDNNECGNSVQKFDSFILIPDCSNSEFELYEPYFEYDYSDGRLYINEDVIVLFSNLFPLNHAESQSFIKDWFENRFGVEIKFTAF